MLTTVHYAVSQLCVSIKAMLPVTAMLMLVLAGVIYAAGQILGAETRARANVWATACLTGALISILIVVVAQPVLQSIYGDQGTIECDPYGMLSSQS
jgi:Na+-driven multidrug efflux pump